MAETFRHKVVWITGGGSGIGEAMALEFGRRGARVAVSGRRRGRLDAVVSRLEAAGAEGLAVPLDVTDEQAFPGAVAAIIARFGRMDVAVANAGVLLKGAIGDLTADDWRRILDINVVGLALTVSAALPHLEQTGGRVALMGSVAGYASRPQRGAYNASKKAVRAIGETLSAELAGTGVSCTSLHPGYVVSEIHEKAGDDSLDTAIEGKRRDALRWPADRAARVMVRAIERRRREVVVTGHGRIFAWLGRHLPWLVHAVTSAAYRKARG